MANTAIEIPFYVAKDGQPLTGASTEMNFEDIKTIDGVDKSLNAPLISEIGGGWYKFSVAYGTAPFDEGDLVGVINADKDGVNNMANVEKYIPIEVRLDFYALSRLVSNMSQDKLTGDMLLKNDSGDTILKLGITDSATTLDRVPGVQANMDTKFFDSLHEGDSANGIKLGMGITGGDFWPRILGCRNLYRSEDIPLIDLAKLIKVIASDSDSIISEENHQPGEKYFYAIRQVNSCGYEERTFGTVLKVAFDGNGDLVVESGSNNIFEVEGEQENGSECRLIWYYCPINQLEEVDHFNIYSNGGVGEIDYDNIVGTIAYSDPRYYIFDSGVLAEGVYRYCIRTVSASGKENGYFRFVQIYISDEKPTAVESVQAESVQ